MVDSTVGIAEQLWGRAHDEVKRGNFAQAVRDLAQCFQILQGNNDPRLYEVHRRWTEVHQMYLEDGAREQQKPAADTVTWQAQAEAAANAGDLAQAIALYERVRAQNAGNELVAERLSELYGAQQRAAQLRAPAAAVAATEDDWSDVASAVQAAAPASAAAAPPTTQTRVTTTEDDWSDVNVDEAPSSDRAATTVVPSAASPRAHSTSTHGASTHGASTHGASAHAVSARVATTAPTMAVADAPVGMHSIDVAVGATIAPSRAASTPVDGGAATDVDVLHELLGRVAARRRPVPAAA